MRWIQAAGGPFCYGVTVASQLTDIGDGRVMPRVPFGAMVKAWKANA